MPARAPRPGVGRRIEVEQSANDELDSGFEITCDAETKTVTVLVGDFDFNDDVAIHAQFGCGAAVNLPQVAPDHVLFIAYYWIGLRHSHKDQRPLKKLLAKYGSLRKYNDAGFHVFALGAMADAFAEEFGVDESDIDDEETEETADPTQPDEPSGTPGPDGPSSTDSTPGTSEGDGS